MWNPETNIKGPKGDPGDVGPQGPPGADGADGEGGGVEILTGAGAPADAAGSDGDFYIDTITGKIYGPKQPAGTPVPDTIAFRSQSTLPFTLRPDTIVPKPAGAAADDILVAVVLLVRAPAPTAPVPPAGWTQVGTWVATTGGGSNIKFGIFWKRATASEPADYTWAHFEACNSQAVMQAWTGCLETGDPVDAFSQNSAVSGSAATATGIAATVADTMLLYLAHNWDGTGTLNPPTGMTERFDVVAYAASQALTAAGATGDRTQTLSSSNPWAAFLVALKPGSVAGAVWPEAIDYATQAELVAGLATKEPSITGGTTSQFWRGDKTWAIPAGGGGAGTTISDTAPASPAVGQMWYESDSGNTFIWYADADSSQWVQVNVQPAAPVVPAVVGTAQARNRIVNGAMQISQEKTKNVSIPIATTLNAFPADQWQASHTSSAAAFTSACVDSVANPDALWRIRMNVGATADAAIAAGDYARFYQAIEGIRIADFAWGTASAKQVVLRFTARSTVAGTFCVALRNGDALNRSYIKNCVLAAANTDQEFVLVIPGDTTGTWATDTTHALTLLFTTTAGTTFQGVEGWQAGNVQATSAISNFLGTASATFDITKVGLYLDPANTGKAPDWVMPDEAEELRACQRYYEVMNGANTLIWSGSATNAGAYFNSTQFKVPKRVTPSVVATGGSASGFPTTPGALTVSDEAVREQRTANATTVAAYFYTSTFNINARM